MCRCMQEGEQLGKGFLQCAGMGFTLMMTACSHSLKGVRFTPGHSWLYHLNRQLFCVGA